MTKKIRKLTHNKVPASVGLVKEVRNELRAEIQSVGHKLDSIEHKIGSLNHKIDSVDKKEACVRSDLRATENRLLSKFDDVIVSVHRTQVLMEEQRGENKIVLDGIKNLIERQDRLESDFRTFCNSI